MTTILILEDDPGSAQLLKAALDPLVHKLFLARTGDEALDIVHKRNPSLVIADLRLPGRHTGWDVIAEIRGNRRIQQMPIIVTSVEVDPTDRQRAFDAGCDLFFPKPFNIHELRETVRGYLI